MKRAARPPGAERHRSAAWRGSGGHDRLGHERRPYAGGQPGWAPVIRVGDIGRDTALWYAGRRAVRPHGFGPARRVAAPLSWLAARTSRRSAAAQDVLLVEAEATLACVHGCRPIPSLVQAEGYFRAVAP